MIEKCNGMPVRRHGGSPRFTSVYMCCCCYCCCYVNNLVYLSLLSSSIKWRVGTNGHILWFFHFEDIFSPVQAVTMIYISLSYTKSLPCAKHFVYIIFFWSSQLCKDYYHSHSAEKVKLSRFTSSRLCSQWVAVRQPWSHALRNLQVSQSLRTAEILS